MFNALYGVVTVIVIGRFIAPVEPGAARTAIATVLLIEVVSGAGISDAVVRSSSGDTIVTDTAFVVALAFALLGMVACALAAYPIAVPFGDQLHTTETAGKIRKPSTEFLLVPLAISRRFPHIVGNAG